MKKHRGAEKIYHEKFDLDDGDAPMPFVVIRWCDAMSHTDEWKDQEDYIAWANGIEWLIETAGWILKENKEYILIAQQRGNLTNCQYQYSMVVKIPKTWIKLRIDLTDSI